MIDYGGKNTVMANEMAGMHAILLMHYCHRHSIERAEMGQFIDSLCLMDLSI